MRGFGGPVWIALLTAALLAQTYVTVSRARRTGSVSLASAALLIALLLVLALRVWEWRRSREVRPPPREGHRP